MITLEKDRLAFRFPEVHADATCGVHFQRTLRIPDDGRKYPLPPGLGDFPLRHLDDFSQNLSADWQKRGGVIMPMYQAEAMWIAFGDRWGDGDYPFALKIAAGKINAVTGEAWTPGLNDDPQDYVVLPKQPWLDGYVVEKGVIRQFVAMPLGQGYTAEEQIARTAEHGGIQLVAYPMKAERYEALLAARLEQARPAACFQDMLSQIDRHPSMGLAPGGRMKQEIYDDPYGLEAWDQRHASRCSVTILNTGAWLAVTGERPPTEPPSARTYAKANLPWFDYYDADGKALGGSPILAKLKSVVGLGKDKGEAPLPENGSVETGNVIGLGPRRSAEVREPVI
jgi:hypothetical protein